MGKMRNPMQGRKGRTVFQLCGPQGREGRSAERRGDLPDSEKKRREGEKRKEGFSTGNREGRKKGLGEGRRG